MTSKKRGRDREIRCYISYSHVDGQAYAARLREQLKALGLIVLWVEGEIPAGSRWLEALTDLMDRTDVLILIGSRGALASEYARSEVEYFQRRGGRIFPIFFGDFGGGFQSLWRISCGFERNQPRWIRAQV